MVTTPWWWAEGVVGPLVYLGPAGVSVRLWLSGAEAQDDGWNWDEPSRALFTSRRDAEVDDPRDPDGPTAWGILVANGAVLRNGVLRGWAPDVLVMDFRSREVAPDDEV